MKYVADLISAMGVIYDFIISQFATVFSTITENPVLFLPVLVALFGSLLFFVIKVVRRLGVRGKRG